MGEAALSSSRRTHVAADNQLKARPRLDSRKALSHQSGKKKLTNDSLGALEAGRMRRGLRRVGGVERRGIGGDTAPT